MPFKTQGNDVYKPTLLNNDKNTETGQDFDLLYYDQVGEGVVKKSSLGRRMHLFQENYWDWAQPKRKRDAQGKACISLSSQVQKQPRSKPLSLTLRSSSQCHLYKEPVSTSPRSFWKVTDLSITAHCLIPETPTTWTREPVLRTVCWHLWTLHF